MYNDILKATIAFIKTNSTYPTFPDMLKLGFTRKAIDHHFGNITSLRQKAYEFCSDIIFDLEKEDYKQLPKSSTRRFVITTAILGGKVHQGFLKNINKYCRLNNSELIVIPSVLNLTKTGWILDPALRDNVIVTQDLQLNNNVFILGIKNNAKTADPITGLPRIGQRNGTFISASPKQRLKYIATGTGKMPHALMSTGAVTYSDYDYKGLMIDKGSYTADNDHVLGAIVLELDVDNTFHFRQIQADKDGSFIDLGVMYKKGFTHKVRPEALIVGDWHCGATDPKVVNALKSLNAKLKPKQWIMHDLFDGLSVNPHLEGKYITKAKLAELGLNSLKNELELLKRDIDMLSSITDKVIIVASNHDDFVNRYLDKGTYVQDALNKRLALDLAIHLCDGKNPLEEYIGKKKNVKWLKIDESYKIAGIECGMHGHLGSNGGRPNIGSMENGYGSVIYGHTHTAQILRDTWNVGTSTLMDLGYNRGASSWTQTSCLIYENGQKQLINFINGRYAR